MMILIGNAIKISNPTQKVLDFCRNHLTINNPDYYNKERMGKWTGNTPRTLQLYEKHGDNILIPYGCKKHILAASACAYGVWDEYCDIDDFKADYKSQIELYDYQQEVVDIMQKSVNGVVVMPCGSGKTQTALELVARLGLKTLWLTHTQDLLHQSMERAKSCFGCNADMFGTITAGKVNISKGITFATVQTMCKIDLPKYRKQWAVIIVDECQHCCGSPTRVTQFYKVVNNLYAPYKFGLTATPDRSDGLDVSMYALLGDVIVNVDKSKVQETTCKVKVELMNTNFYPEPDNVLNGDGTINYSALVDELTNDPERFNYISSMINMRCKSFSMVLANRVQYLKELQAEYSGKSVCISGAGTSQKARQERKEALRMLNCGEIDCIFATYQLAAEGLDCPNLRYVVFATPEKDKRTVMQAAGRVARKANGKQYGTVIDFVDSFGMYQGWSKKRIGYYKKMGFDFV